MAKCKSVRRRRDVAAGPRTGRGHRLSAGATLTAGGTRDVAAGPRTGRDDVAAGASPAEDAKQGPEPGRAERPAAHTSLATSFTRRQFLKRVGAASAAIAVLVAQKTCE